MSAATLPVNAATGFGHQARGSAEVVSDPTAYPSTVATRADRPKGVGRTKSKARPDQNPTMAPVSGPSSRAAVIGSSHTMSGCTPWIRSATRTVDCAISSQEDHESHPDHGAGAHDGGAHWTTST